MDHTSRHFGGINLEMYAPTPALSLTDPSSPIVIIKESEVSLVMIEPGVMLPGKVSSCAVAYITELIPLAAEIPNWTSVLATNKSYKR